LIERPEVARALEHDMLHAIIHCLTADEAGDNTRARCRHAAVVVRFEELINPNDQRLSMRSFVQKSVWPSERCGCVAPNFSA
jgi:hypothetical protein